MKHVSKMILAMALFLGFIPSTGSAQSLESLLLSSPWCSFTYNQTTGYSHTKRIQFFSNGTYSLGKGGEGYSSGYAGTFASQHSSGGGGQWALQGNQLFLSDQSGTDVFNLRVKTNSSGYPVIMANGVEYSACQ